ncbi:MAG: 5'/3'-nucleotidase SurE [Spirochaetes bacterium]|nr:MAG: 5'/3'-nucleotidase SurE [Spirochaetota bacterium]
MDKLLHKFLKKCETVGAFQAGRMNILLTNDDGINAAGINILARILCERHEIYVIAPHEEKSACSSAITVRRGLAVEKLSDNRFSVEGFPADCVNIGLHSGLIPEMDLVISGINHGPNLGDDVYFSGTVAGARTAFIFGTSGIAISIDCLRTSDYFEAASRFIMEYIDPIGDSHIPHPFCLNINYPDIPADEISGIRYCSLSKRRYIDNYIITDRHEGGMHLQLNGSIETDEVESTDYYELQRGAIAITPLTLDSTDYPLLQSMSKGERPWKK